MSAGAVAMFAWLLPHLAALESDFSVFHRVDDMYVLPVSVWERRVSQLPAYGGAFALVLQHETVPERPVRRPDGEMTEAEVKAKFRQILIETYPDEAAGGIREVSAEEMEREVKR